MQILDHGKLNILVERTPFRAAVAGICYHQIFLINRFLCDGTSRIGPEDHRRQCLAYNFALELYFASVTQSSQKRTEQQRQSSFVGAFIYKINKNKTK